MAVGLHDRRPDRLVGAPRGAGRPSRPRDARVSHLAARPRAGRGRPGGARGWVARLEPRGPPRPACDSFLEALDARHGAFHDAGLPRVGSRPRVAHAEPLRRRRSRAAFDRLRAGHACTPARRCALNPPCSTASRSWITRAAGSSSSTWARCATQTRGCARRSAATAAPTPSATSSRRGRWPRFLDRPGRDRPAGAHHPLQLEPARQRALREHDRQLPGRHARQDAVRRRLVVPGPAAGHGAPARRSRTWACCRSSSAW